MNNDRSRAGGWFRAAATLAATLSIVGISIADDAAKPKRLDRRPPASSKTVPLPEVIRTEEHEDVDGKTRKAPEAPKPKGAPTLTSARLDEMILKGLGESQTPVSPPTTDEEFIRRVYLDVLGRLPNPGSIREFVASRLRNKRALLIDTLLNEREYAQNWARYWRDVVSYRAPNENERQINYPEFETWLADQFAANKPWDQIATEIITATGRNDENGAAVFAVAQQGSAVEMAGEVSRVFMGIQIQCAQCHDHPSDPWKRIQFHEFAAFFAGVSSKRADKPEKGKTPAFMVSVGPRVQYSMPDLKNPEKKIPVAPRFFLNDAPRVGEQVRGNERLRLAAQYVTDPENPWFARAYINRVWYALIGEGFYNPVDDLGPTRTPNSPEVLDLIAENWVRSGYDVRWLFRLILNTEAYQRASRSTNSASGLVPFASNVPSRLRADQILDNLIHALDLDKERAKVGMPLKKAEMMAKPDHPAIRDQVNKTFGIDPSTPIGDVLGSIPQALFLMNSPIVTKEVQARPNTMLGFLLLNHPDNKSVLDILYMRVLGRKPTPREIQACQKHLMTVGDRAEAFEDILWALINSTEFVSRR